MARSLVARLSLLVALIVGASFVLLTTILLRSTSVAFVRTTEMFSQQPSPDALQQRVMDSVRKTYRQSGRSGLQRLAAAPEQFELPPDLAFLIVGSDLKVVASTEAVLRRATVTEQPSGDWHVAVGEAGRANTELQLRRPTGTELRDADGQVFAHLLLLPGPLDQHPGDSFALGVWRSAALWLLAVVGISMLATALVLRWFLRPIDQLTEAAQLMVEGQPPVNMALSGHTEIDRLISAFNAATTAVAQTETMRRQLIADIGHELRTPVTNLRAQLEAVDAGLIVADAELLATLAGEVALLAELVEDFQQLALSDAGQLRLTLEALPLLATLEAIITPMAQCAGAQCCIDVEAHLQVRADAQRLRQVFGNLVENSRRHRSEGLVLSLGAECAGASIKIRFADNGPGIAPADQPHVFERFYRTEKSRNRASGGAGLGLTIAKAIIEAMHGQIRVLPVLDGGAVFEIELPRSD